MDQTGADRGASSAEVRQRLLEVAAHMVREQGAPALSARKLAAAAGTSTMAVYTHFGGMPGLVRAMVAEGFRRLFERVAAVPVTDDPLTTCATQPRPTARTPGRTPTSTW